MAPSTKHDLTTGEYIVFLWKMQVLAVIKRTADTATMSAYFLLRNLDEQKYVSISRGSTKITIEIIQQTPAGTPQDLFFYGEQGFIDLHYNSNAVIVGTGDLRLLTLELLYDLKPYQITGKRVILTAVDEFHLQLFHVNNTTGK